MKTMSWAVGFGMVALVAACAGGTDDGGEAREVTGQQASAMAASGQGGCSMGQIHEAQSICGGSIAGCWGNACPARGGDICSDGSYFYQCSR